MKIALPAKVLLRNKTLGTITGPAQDLAPYALFGHTEEGAQLWHRDGKWREDRQPHPLDIVGVIDPQGAQEPLTDHFS